MAKLLKHLAVVQRVLCEFNRRISPAKIVWDQVFRDQNIRRVSKLNYLAKPFPVLLRVHRTAIPQKQRVAAMRFRKHGTEDSLVSVKDLSGERAQSYPPGPFTTIAAAFSQ